MFVTKVPNNKILHSKDNAQSQMNKLLQKCYSWSKYIKWILLFSEYLKNLISFVFNIFLKESKSSYKTLIKK